VPRRSAKTRSEALILWAAARERAGDELLSRAAQLWREGLEDEAARLRAAAQLLRQRAREERAQAAACRADETSKVREVGGRGHPVARDLKASHRVRSRRKVGG
jgi:hypothetical protein